MYSKTTVVINPTGIHARPASAFVKQAKEFACRVKVKNLSSGEDAEYVNAKSIVSVLSAEMCLGHEIEIMADGDCEEAAVNALVELVRSGFGEV